MGHGDRSWGLMSMGMHAHFRYAHVWEAHGCMCVRAWFIEDINPYAQVQHARTTRVQVNYTQYTRVMSA